MQGVAAPELIEAEILGIIQEKSRPRPQISAFPRLQEELDAILQENRLPKSSVSKRMIDAPSTAAKRRAPTADAPAAPSFMSASDLKEVAWFTSDRQD